MVTKVRQALLEKALKEKEANSVHGSLPIGSLEGRSRKNSTRKTNPLGRSEAEERLFAQAEVVPSRKYKKRHLKTLTANERAAIVHGYLVECLSQQDVARRHRVSTSMVGRL